VALQVQTSAVRQWPSAAGVIRRVFSMITFVVALTLLVALAVADAKFIVRETVREYQCGLLYRYGRFHRQVGPGKYWIFRYAAHLTILDLRRTLTVVPGQEILSADKVPVKISITCAFEITDPTTAVHAVDDYQMHLHTSIQLAIRDELSETDVENFLEQKQIVSEKCFARVQSDAQKFGIKVISVDIRDIMFPGDLKKTFAEVVRAQTESKAAIERARGETAALRSLANAAKMMKDNPQLLELRTLQAIESFSPGSGHTIVFGTKEFNCNESSPQPPNHQS
jgi:regulator of protease activity HflC (stomatin/prohibitin superfamily)